MRGGLMVCGTNSDAGKSHVVAGLCRLLSRRGVRVAPFKAQNMALNSYVTPSGHEIGRAQAVQALAAGVEPEVAMNPILLKPTGERSSQVVVLGRPWAHLEARAYHAVKPQLFEIVLRALADLRRRFDVVVCEGAGSPAELNFLDTDIVNLGLAAAARLPAIVVGDIDRGGVFAALYGTVALLPSELRSLVRGFVINKLRGDPALLFEGPAELERRSGVPTLGVLPYLADVAIDAEDSLALNGRRPRALAPPLGSRLDVVAVRFPRISNFTDLDALSLEPGVGVRLVDEPGAVGDPDLLVLPGTKATLDDLAWLRKQGLEGAIATAASRGTLVLGVCGGYQMLGQTITDEVESGALQGREGVVAGLGHLDVETTFVTDKITRQRSGTAMGQRITGYEIRHGRVHLGPTAVPWVSLGDAHGEEAEGARSSRSALGSFLGTSLHGLFEQDEFRAVFLREVGRRRGKDFVPAGISFAAARNAQLDRLADLLEAQLDLKALEKVIEEGATSP